MKSEVEAECSVKRACVVQGCLEDYIVYLEDMASEISALRAYVQRD